MIKLSKVKVFFITISYLKFTQIFFRIYFRLGGSLFWRKKVQFNPPRWKTKWSPPSKLTRKDKTITFFGETASLDFHPQSHQKNSLLWKYNLHYFDYLRGLGREEGIELIERWLGFNERPHEISWDPYPTSLRICNWIEFSIIHNFYDDFFIRNLHEQCDFLSKKLELHLLGNHYLENLRALTLASCYFSDYKTLTHYLDKIEKVFDEQIYLDGVYFEISPLYQTILAKEFLIWVRLMKEMNFHLSNRVEQKVDQLSLAALDFYFENKNLSLLNDSSLEMAPSFQEIKDLREICGFTTKKEASISLQESGLHLSRNEKSSLLINGANPPRYIPGHWHACAGTWELSSEGERIITERGTSTYLVNRERQLDRSTSSHNLPYSSERDQSQVWASFRLGKRAFCEPSFKGQNEIELKIMDSYGIQGLLHKRRFILEKNELRIQDGFDGASHLSLCHALHFGPQVIVKGVKKHSLIIQSGSNTVEIGFSEGFTSSIEDYSWFYDHGRFELAKKLVLKSSKLRDIDLVLRGEIFEDLVF